MTQLVDDATIEKNANRILERVSPSQIEAYRLCPRRWWNDSGRGLREPLLPGGAAERGVHIAEEVEHVGQTGAIRSDARYKAMVEAVLPFLSEPSPTVSVEQWVELETEPGLPIIRGRYDWFDCSQRVWVEGHPRAPLLPDVKSRSDFRYAKTPAELKEDVQLNTYALALVRRDGYDFMTTRHAYTRTRGKPKGMAVSVTISREELEAFHLKTIETVREMTRWAKERPRTADPLPPNTEACGKFPPHGCPHRALCGFDASQRAPFQALKESTTMADTNGAPVSDLMKRLQQRTKELTGGAPAAGPTGAPSRPVEPTGTGPAEPAQAAPKPIFCKDCGEKLTPDNVSRLRDGVTIVHIGCPSKEEPAEAAGPAVVSPDAPPRTNPPISYAESAEAAAHETPKAKRAPRAKKADPAQAELTSSPGRDPALDAEAVRRAQPSNIKGPSGYYTIGQLEDMSAEAPKEVNPAIAKAAEQMGAASATVDRASGKVVETTPQRQKVGPVVYVNCVPTKGAHKGTGVFFEEWLAPICEELCQEKGVVDYRLIQYTAKGDLAAKIRKYISLCPEVVLVSKFSPSADVFLESVIPHASQIIQGV